MRGGQCLETETLFSLHPGNSIEDAKSRHAGGNSRLFAKREELLLGIYCRASYRPPQAISQCTATGIHNWTICTGPVVLPT
jgi:hypothetical protein